MIPTSFDLELLTPLATHRREGVTSLNLSLENGMVTLLPGHAALVGSIDATPLVVQMGSHEERFMLRNGVVWVQPTGKVVLKALFLEKYEDLNEVQIQEYVAMILEKIQQGENLQGFHLEFLKQEHLMLDRQLKAMV